MFLFTTIQLQLMILSLVQEVSSQSKVVSPVCVDCTKVSFWVSVQRPSQALHTHL